MNNNNVIYGKIKRPDGSWEEDKTMIARELDDKIIACFVCKKAFTCEARHLNECHVYNGDKTCLKENVACFSDKDI